MQKKERKETVRSLLSYISDERFDFFAKETSVDWNVKKLSGKELFQLCLFGILHENRASSRVFESFYENHFFVQSANIEQGKRVSHSSIADRISKINVVFFEQLYQYCVRVFEKKLKIKETSVLSIYDSTITSLSSKLLSFGMENGQKNKEGEQGRKGIKFTIGFNGLPFKVNIHQEQSMISEDLALGDILNDHVASKNDIAIFDRGMKDRRKMEKLSIDEQYFVTRINKNSKYQTLKDSKVETLDFENDTIKLLTAQQVYLYDGRGKKVKIAFRLIEGILKDNNEKILILSNLPEGDFESTQIAEIYRNRWQIECFFRFIKQELNFKHYFSRSLNGIQVMTYIILIASILLLTYIKLNKLKGYKIPRISFCHELQNEILQQIIIHCGGDLSKMQTFT